MKKEMLINVLQPEECRIAILEDDVLEELYVERTSQESYVGNIYKGRIVNIEPSIQAAFVDFGIGRNGFLHVSDVDPAYYRHLLPRGPGEGPVAPRHREEFDEEAEPEPPRAGRTEPPADEPKGSGPVRRTEVPPDDDDDRPRRPRRDEPAQVNEGDPYAGLMSEATAAPAEPEEIAEVPTPEESRSRRGRGGRSRRGGRDPEESPRGREARPPQPPLLAPEPPAEEPSGFGAGIDLWGDEPPPPYMPAAERRTTDDSDPPESGGGEPRGRGRRNDRDGRGRGRRGDRSHHRGRDGDGHQKPLIQNIFKRGQEVIVQVIKEGIGTKGPTLSTYISVAGRYLVLMPGLSRIGVSRKIDDADARHRLRDILAELKPPQGLGFIIRTAGMDRTKKELQNDLAYLLRIWQVVVKRIRSQKAPAPIHQESDMITRTIRDTFTADVAAIYIDEPTAYQHALEFLQGVMPRYAGRLKLYDETEPLFHRYGIEAEIARIQQKKLPLPAGGSIIIEQAEALVAIDVNSGTFRADSNNADETAYQINLQAAKEIARQLRLRDLGGVIVNDFIDMKDEKHRRGVEKAMRDAVKRDRARTKVLRISQFGLIEMTRQRIRPSLRRSVFQECPHCAGNGHVKTTESMSIEVMRLVQLAACREHVRRIDVRVHAAVADYLVNRKRREVAALEEKAGVSIQVTGLRDVSPERLDFVCYDCNNAEVSPHPAARPSAGRRR